ncbi:MAG: alpha/beta hydrolase [Rubrivivax sp.]|nr:alpha/beta hydrolase [Rubrivivax sp.]
MTPTTLVFSHANGFPAGSYRQIFEVWQQAGLRVLALEKFGHDPASPITSNWRPTRDELIRFVETQAPGEQVHLVGHSLGGYLSLLAACRRPDLAASVVLLDSPVLSGWRAHGIRVAKLMRLIERVSPGKVSRARRQQWPTRDDAHRHFAAKAVFARWAPGVLDDYIAAGTEADEMATPGSVRLAFARQIETRFYNTLPHHMGLLLRRHPPRCPVAFIGGTQSVEVRQVGMAATRAVTHGHVEWIAGSHLFPMEQPAATAAAVLRLLTPPR